MTDIYATIRVEDWLRGPLQVADSGAARANKDALEAHLRAEWSSDLDATMATIHPDDPWQIMHGLGVEVRGFEPVRGYYAGRFETWPGPGMESFSRVTIAETSAYLECQLTPEPDGAFGGRATAAGAKLDVPAVIIVDFRDGLVLGETLFLDSTLAREQLGAGG